MKGKNVRWLAPIISLIFLANIFANIPPARVQQEPATIYADYVIDHALQAGEKFNVTVGISGAHDLHTWQVRLYYNTSMLTAMWLYYGDFLNGSARDGPWGVLIHDAPAGQKRVNVTDSSKFGTDEKWLQGGSEGSVLIKDDNNWEINTMLYPPGKDPFEPALAAYTLTMTNNLAHTYNMSANAVAYPWPAITQAARFNPDLGYVQAGEATDGPYPGAEGDGLLVKFEFLVNTYGSSDLTFSEDRTWYMDSSLIMKTVASGDLVLSDGYFRNKYPGDVDGDKYVGSSDFSVLAGAYGSPPRPYYNRETDFDNDGYIGSGDFSVLAGNYGITFP